MILRKLYIETYGCQMNFSDSEIVAAVMANENFEQSTDPHTADIIFLNTCSIRDHAEKRVFGRLRELKSLKKKNPQLIIGVLGCMAERLRHQLLEGESAVDMVVGPDSYRDLPRLLTEVRSGIRAVNVLLSSEETYADINPVRIASNGVSAFISIMRGCENYCSYCVVPFTRGKERSRSPVTIIGEATELFAQGYREITFLGQNVNSYHFDQNGKVIHFPDLLEQAARIDNKLRIRFATSHPKDLSDDLLKIIAAFPNLCRSIHLPLQSGSNRILNLMNRKYSSEYYLDRVRAIRDTIAGCTVTTDIIAGFCSETDSDHQDTLRMMKSADFEYAYMFQYSERPGTKAAENLKDDVSAEIKNNRLKEIIGLQQELSHAGNKSDVGKIFEVLTEGKSRKSEHMMMGRTSHNKVVVFESESQKHGEYCNVMISDCTSATLVGKLESEAENI